MPEQFDDLQKSNSNGIWNKRLADLTFGELVDLLLEVGFLVDSDKFLLLSQLQEMIRKMVKEELSNARF